VFTVHVVAGHALLATHKATGAKRAVKVISKSKFSRASDKKLHFQELRNEIEVMRKVSTQPHVHTGGFGVPRASPIDGDDMCFHSCDAAR